MAIAMTGGDKAVGAEGRGALPGRDGQGYAVGANPGADLDGDRGRGAPPIGG